MQAFRRATILIATLVALLPWTGAMGVKASSPSTVANPALWKSLTQAQQGAIQRNGFVVGPVSGQYPLQQFYDLYKQNLNTGRPSFITTDAILHMFHIMYDKTLMAMERELLEPKLAQLSAGLMSVAVYQHGVTHDPQVQEAAKLNLGYVSVAESLLNPRARIPSLVAPQVRAELALIAEHRGFALSPLFGYEADYSQFAPRGHYNDSEALRRYFRAMTWYGRMSFALSGTDAPLRTRQALLLVRGVTLVHRLSSLWSAIFDPATEWVGHSDDLSIRDYAAVMNRVYPKNAPVSALADSARIAHFIALARAFPNPQITGDVAGSGGNAMKGMRFFPQRFIPDGSIMQALIWNKVGTRQNMRLWPMGLDVAASLGSAQAATLLTGPLHQNRYAHYTQQLNRIRQHYAALPSSAWTQNLYWRWLDTLRAVWSAAPRHAPAFMARSAWAEKSLAAGLGSWAELRHDTLLYAKQPYGLGAGGGPPPFRVPYVEPVPLVWGRLLDLTHAFKAVLTREGLLSHLAETPDQLPPQTTLYPVAPRGERGYRAAIDSFAGLVALLQRTAQEELQGKSLGHADAVTLENVGNELEILDNFFQDNAAGKVEMPDQKQVAIIADVFTEPGSGQVLEEGVGDVLPLYAVVTINGRPWLAVGGAFTYYEFHQPMSNRLTDEAWRAMKHRPPLPGWTAGYILAR